MRLKLFFLLVSLALYSSICLFAEDMDAKIRKAVERSTLDQPGTKPFHLKAAIAPSFERDSGSGRTGTVEMWWVSPTRWRREVRSPEFQQIEIVDGDHDWQKNDGDYFPEWLREIAVELVKPVPPLDHVLEEVKNAEVRVAFGGTHVSWGNMGNDGSVTKMIGAGITLDQRTGLLQYGSEVGWSGGFQSYQGFHNREVARKVTSGSSPEVTATVTVLEDLPTVPESYFDATAPGGDSMSIHTIVADELAVRKNLIPGDPIIWPKLENGPLAGAIITTIVIDMQGRVRFHSGVLSDNPGIEGIAGDYVSKMKFKPFLVNGLPVQVVTTLTFPFKTARPPGYEIFDSARTFFERGNKATYPSGGGSPYFLRADFSAMGSGGAVLKGRYEDTWVTDSQWRREAWFDTSHLVRARYGETQYLLVEGPEAGLLRLVFKELEPIPAIDTFTESDWRIKRDRIDDIATIRVLKGAEKPDGSLDPEHSTGYWFDESGHLVRDYIGGLDSRNLEFVDFNKISVPRRVNIAKNGKLAMRIDVTELTALTTPVQNATFQLKGHEWKRQFTDQVR
jgi:hypothetical protein